MAGRKGVGIRKLRVEAVCELDRELVHDDP